MTAADTYPKKGSDSSKTPPPLTAKNKLGPFKENERITALHILDWLRPHLIALSQLYYPLMQYVDESVLQQIISAWKPETYRWLPDSFKRLPRGSLRFLDNGQFVYVVQLLVRPMSPDVWIERLVECNLPEMLQAHQTVSTAKRYITLTIPVCWPSSLRSCNS